MPPIQFAPLRYLCTAIIAVLLSGASASAQTAAPKAEEAIALSTPVAERLVIAGRQRMLAEGMAASLCLVLSDLATETNRGKLYVNWNIFEWYHQAILRGNRALGLTLELDPQVLAAWNGLDKDWKVLRPAYEPSLAGQPISDAEIDRIKTVTEAVTQRATDLVASLRSAYSHELGPQGFGAALLLDLYERQRMLGQSILKDVCLIARGLDTEARRKKLMRTAEIFSTSIDAFISGLEEVGIRPPPTPQIIDSLVAARTHWQPVTALAFASAQGMQLDRGALAEFADAMDLFNAQMTAAINALVTHYGG